MRHKIHEPGQTYLVRHQAETFGESFFDDACYKFYLARLFNSLAQFHIKLHAYCLLPDQVCLLLTPLTPTGTCGLLRSVGRQYNDYYHQRFSRPLGVFGNHIESNKAGDAENALEYQKCIERLPLDQRLVTHPGAYRWSSYCANAFGGKSSHLVAHPGYFRFIAGLQKPYPIYREFIACPSTQQSC